MFSNGRILGVKKHFSRWQINDTISQKFGQMTNICGFMLQKKKKRLIKKYIIYKVYIYLYVI